MTVTRWFKIDPSCRKDHDVPEDKGDLIVGMRHEEGCELRRVHWHSADESPIGVHIGPTPCGDCGARPGDGHYEMWERADPLPVDPDKDQDFEDLARILNRINDKHPEAMRDAFTHTFQPKEDDVSPPFTFTRAEVGEELPARKLYDENEARAIEHVATARGMLLGELLNEAENEFNRRVVDLLTSALMELVPHDR